MRIDWCSGIRRGSFKGPYRSWGCIMQTAVSPSLQMLSIFQFFLVYSERQSWSSPCLRIFYTTLLTYFALVSWLDVDQADLSSIIRNILSRSVMIAVPDQGLPFSMICRCFDRNCRLFYNLTPVLLYRCLCASPNQPTAAVLLIFFYGYMTWCRKQSRMYAVTQWTCANAHTNTQQIWNCTILYSIGHSLQRDILQHIHVLYHNNVYTDPIAKLINKHFQEDFQCWHFASQHELNRFWKHKNDTCPYFLRAF